MLHIDQVEWAGEHLLRLTFDNGIEKTVNVLPLLIGPVFHPLKQVAEFSAVTLDPVARTVAWPNGADLAPEALFALSSVDILSPG